MFNDQCLDIFKKRPNLYLTGGYVRDALLGIESRDVDLIYDGDVFVLGSDLKAKYPILKYIEYRKYLSISFELDNFQYTVTQSREERYINGKLHISSCSIEGDFQRRDYTVNSIAYNIFEKQFLDPFHGRLDLKSRILKKIASISDDPSRILRGIRLSLKYNLEIDRKTEEEMIKNISLIPTLPKYLLDREMKKFDKIGVDKLRGSTLYLKVLGVLN